MDRIEKALKLKEGEINTQNSILQRGLLGRVSAVGKKSTTLDYKLQRYDKPGIVFSPFVDDGAIVVKVKVENGEFMAFSHAVDGSSVERE